MKLVLSQPNVLKNLIDVVSNLVNECHISINPTHMQIIAMDPANVAMVNMRMNSSIFSEYDVGNGGKLGINLMGLKQILRRLASNDVLTIETEESILKINMRAENRNRTFTLSLLDIEGREIKEPDFKHYLTVSMPSTVFSDAIEDASIASDSLQLVTMSGKFVLLAHGDLNTAKIEVPTGDEISIDLNMVERKSQEGEDKVSARFAREYLEKMTDGSKISNRVIFNYKKDHPISLTYKNEHSELKFLLAPRIENE